MSGMFLKNLWRDERGDSSIAAYLLLVAILCLGIIPGLSAIRSHVVQEFGDVAVALQSLDQSYSFSLGSIGGVQLPGTSVYVDTPPTDGDPDGGAPAGISVGAGGTPEG